MKNKSIAIISAFFVACGLFFSCKNGVTIDENTFRSVASFLLPAIDESTGSAVFTPEFTLTNEIGQYEQIDNETAFLRITGKTDTETTLNARLALKGLVNNKYGNVKVTTVWIPADTSSASLVKEVHFDKYALMVFATNTGETSYDPSTADVQIKLDTITKNQIGILSFKYEYAQSVYDSEKCIKEYQLVISTGTENKPVVILSRMRATETPEESFSFEGSKSAYTAAYTDFTTLSVPQPVTKNMAIDLLYIDNNHPITLRFETTNNVFSISDIVPMIISGSKGTITFKLNFNPGNLNPAVASGSGNLIIEDPSGYYANLPLSIPLTAKRQIPETDIGGTFPTDGDASPWHWRMLYKVNSGDETGTAVETYIQNVLSDGVQNGGLNFFSYVINL